MKPLDRLSAGTLFLVAINACLCQKPTPAESGFSARTWLCSSPPCSNVLRVRNGYVVEGLKMFCVTANVTMLTFFAALMASIGKATTLGNPQLLLVTFLLIAESIFSLGTDR